VPTDHKKPCRICETGQRISTLTFAVFALALAVAATDPAESILRQIALILCAGLSGLAVFRFQIARIVARHRKHNRRRPSDTPLGNQSP
jgi:hypothetical protein